MNAPHRSATVIVVGSVLVSGLFAIPTAGARASISHHAHAKVAGAHAPTSGGLADEVLGLVNRSRASHGLRTFRPSTPLMREALRHSRRMATRKHLFHTPNLGALVAQYGGTIWGENLARGVNLKAIRDKWLQDPGSRVHLLDPRFRWAAVGVVKRGIFYWVTLQLYD